MSIINNSKITTVVRFTKTLHFEIVRISNLENRSFSNVVETKLIAALKNERIALAPIFTPYLEGPKIATTIRLSIDITNAVVKAAKQGNRSIANYIETLLLQSFGLDNLKVTDTEKESIKKFIYGPEL